MKRLLRTTAATALIGLVGGCGSSATKTGKIHFTVDGTQVALQTTRTYTVSWAVTLPTGYTDCMVDIELGPPGLDGLSRTPLVLHSTPGGSDALTGTKSLPLSWGDHAVTARVLGVAKTPTQTVVDQCPWSVDLTPA